MVMITGFENVSTYWVVREEGRTGRGLPGKIVLDMGRASLETENIIQQNTVFITQVKWSEFFVVYIYVHFRNGFKNTMKRIP